MPKPGAISPDGQTAAGGTALRPPRGHQTGQDRPRQHVSRVQASRDAWSWLDAIAGRLDEDFVSGVREQPVSSQCQAAGKLFR